jgi:hypothetical protein
MQKCLSSLYRPRRLCNPPTRCVSRAISQVLKRQGRKSGYSPPFSAEAKTGGAIPPLPIRLFGIALIYLSTGTISITLKSNSLQSVFYWAHYQECCHCNAHLIHAESRFDFQEGSYFSFAATYRMALGPIQFLVQWVQSSFPPRAGWLCTRMDHLIV